MFISHKKSSVLQKNVNFDCSVLCYFKTTVKVTNLSKMRCVYIRSTNIRVTTIKPTLPMHQYYQA